MSSPIDTCTWRYYASIPLVPSPTDKLHFSMLDRLRHLLVESSELSIRGLRGGLAFWLVRNRATVSALANSPRDVWRAKDAAAIRGQLIRLLDGEIRLFGQVRLDAKQLLHMEQAQPFQPAALVLLNDLATQAQYAYTGQPGGGALWTYRNLQRLAAFEVRPYVAPK